MFAHMFKNFKNNSHERAQNSDYGLNTIATGLRDNGTSAQGHASRNVMWHHLRAALRGDKQAQYEMGLSYLNGQWGLDRNYAHAEKWLDQAALQGHDEAKLELQKALNKLAFS